MWFNFALQYDAMVHVAHKNKPQHEPREAERRIGATRLAVDRSDERYLGEGKSSLGSSPTQEINN